MTLSKLTRPVIYIIEITYFICSMLSASAQNYSPKLGPYSSSNRFQYNSTSTKTLSLRHFIPSNEQAQSFDSYGQRSVLKKNDTIVCANIYKGNWAGKKGDWIQFYITNKSSDNPTNDYYVLQADMQDIEVEIKTKELEIKEAGLKRLRSYFALGLLMLSIVIALIILVLVLKYIRKTSRGKIKRTDLHQPSSDPTQPERKKDLDGDIGRHANAALIASADVKNKPHLSIKVRTGLSEDISLPEDSAFHGRRPGITIDRHSTILSKVYFTAGLVAITLIATFVTRQLNKYVQTEYKAYKKGSPPNIQNLLPVSKLIDPGARPLLTNAQENNYYNGRYNSNVVDSVLFLKPELRKAIGERSFGSLFDLCSFLVSQGEPKLELSCLTIYCKRFFDKSELTGLRYYVEYLNINYLEPAQELAKLRQLDRAKSYIDGFKERMALIDTYPLDKVRAVNRMYINRGYLLNLLLTETQACYRASPYLDKLIPFTRDALPENSIKSALGSFQAGIPFSASEDNDTANLRDYKKYWQSLNLFYQGKYNLAKNLFTEIELQTNNNEWKNITILMQSRCDFWNTIFNNLNTLAATSMIGKSLERQSNQNYKTDMQTYMSYLLSRKATTK